MRKLYVRLALLLGAAFVAVGGLLVVATQTMFDRARLAELSAYLMSAGAAFALLSALCVFLVCTRRLKRLADGVESIAQGGFAASLRVRGADPHGDEIDRLATNVERMSDRIAEQLSELDRVANRRRELLINVSHDLRTPLASMQGYLELLLLRHGSLAPAEERNYLETAVRHSERLGRLVGDLFELTKLEADEVQPQLEEFSLAELAHDVVQKFALDATRRQVDLRARGGGPDPRVLADIGMVERVLENLLDNALRHTPAGGTVTIEFECDAPRARMAVRDTGPGIAAAELPGLFDRYDRASRSVPGGHGGLGLAIARRIVSLHGGELSVQSAVGSGTCFAFDLPLVQRPGPHADSPALTTERTP
jgi:signal transduction histidine kinase